MRTDSVRRRFIDVQRGHATHNFWLLFPISEINNCKQENQLGALPVIASKFEFNPLVPTNNLIRFDLIGLPCPGPTRHFLELIHGRP